MSFRREDCSPELLRRWDAAMAEAVATRLAHAKPVEGLRTALTQKAYYLRSRAPLVEVNAAYRDAGMAPITEEQNKRAITKTLASRHFPNSKGQSRALDFAMLNEKTGQWYDPKVDADGDGIWDFKEMADLCVKHGLRAGYYFPGFCDAGHVELPKGVDE